MAGALQAMDIGVWKGPPVVTFQTSAVDTSDVTNSTYTFSSQAFGTASPGRIIAIFGDVYRLSTAALSITAVTIGGVSATQAVAVGSNTTDNVAGAIWYANVPTGTTGSVVVTVSGTAIACGIGIWSITGQSANAPYLTTSVGQAAGNFVLTRTVAVGDGIVVGCAVSAGTARTFTTTNATENFDQVVETAFTHTGASVSNQSSAGSLSVTVTPSSGYHDGVGVMAVWH